MDDEPIHARNAERSRARWTTYLLFACVALNALGIASGFRERALLHRRVTAGATLLPEAAAATDARQGTIGRLQLAAAACTGIVWLMWLHRAYGNLALVGYKRARFTRGWAVGYWFIPFVNLVRPYQIVKDLWLRSESMNDRDAYDSLPAPGLVSGWWGSYLLYGVSGQLFASLARDAQSLEHLTNVTDAAILVDAVGIVAAVLAIKVVRGIDRRQQLFRVIGAAA